ncbi:synaptogenesis protein syg-2 [Trichonephila inaurata madagascariensis]|uniref:Synaptogenesis protein syg-2 n=1 Tax=Trichonephila inaurata madagascariensis TaxID=2747483 RepID=A0A8X6MEI5_9ARAC|nr:synaptogenesis protein syg-2 [Trichonephila inaurata madagascariensis]
MGAEDPPGIPEIEGYQEGDIVQVGDTLTLACITRGGNPQAELIWYRDNVQVDMSYTTSGREVTNIRTFTVDKTDNNAMYRCEASNSVTYHPRIATVKLSVQYDKAKRNAPRSDGLRKNRGHGIDSIEKAKKTFATDCV